MEVAVAGGGVGLLRGWSVRGNASQSTLVTDHFERIDRLEMELERLIKLSRVGRKAVVILVILYMKGDNLLVAIGSHYAVIPNAKRLIELC